MSRKRRKALPPDRQVSIESMSHDGRGVARVDGKAVFVDGALPGELVLARYVSTRRSFDEASTVEVIAASTDRVEPRCAHFGVCGGCSLQHVSETAQRRWKAQTLKDNLSQIGRVEPETWLEPLHDAIWGYRRKARPGVRYVDKKQRLLIGFREKKSRYLADIQHCAVLHPSIGERLPALSTLIAGLSGFRHIPQLEIAVGDNIAVIVLRHLEPLTDADIQALQAFSRQHELWFYLQAAGPDSITPLLPDTPELFYRPLENGPTLYFDPTDFTQVNAGLNRQMVAQVQAHLALTPDETLLDLFCGLGNFSLPLAPTCQQVTGVEGDLALVEKARHNAQRNHISNATFHKADLMADLRGYPWFKTHYDKVLLDPPRSGARELVEQFEHLAPARVVYVSCNPATLARDAAILVHDKGYRLLQAGIMDMFPHTAHVESIAVFERG